MMKKVIAWLIIAGAAIALFALLIATAGLAQAEVTIAGACLLYWAIITVAKK